MSSGKWTVCAVAGLAVLAGAVAVYRWIRTENTSKLDAEELVARLAAASPERQIDLIFELSQRGETAVPAILRAFEQARGRPALQAALAQAVFRMPPTEATVATLEQMAETADAEARTEIHNYWEMRKTGRRAA